MKTDAHLGQTRKYTVSEFISGYSGMSLVSILLKTLNLALFLHFGHSISAVMPFSLILSEFPSLYSIYKHAFLIFYIYFYKFKGKCQV